MDRTETFKYIGSVSTPRGPQNVADALDLLLSSALRVDKPDEPGSASVEGEYRGEWIELRVTLRKRPAKEA